MKGMPLPFELEGKGVLDLELLFSTTKEISCNFLNKSSTASTNSEPTSVLDTIRSSRSPTSSSTLSSSLGGGGGAAASTDTAGVAAVSGNPSQNQNPTSKWQQESTTASSSNVGAESDLHNLPCVGTSGNPPVTIAGGEKCAMEEWESVLSESVAASPGQEQSILRWIMGDVDDPSLANLNKVLQVGGPAEYEFNGGFGIVDQGFGLDSVSLQVPLPSMAMQSSGFPGNRINEKIGFLSNQQANLSGYKLGNPQNPIFPSLANNLGAVGGGLSQAQQCSQQSTFESAEMKPQIFNPQILINQHQTQHKQNPSFFLPLSYAQTEQQNLVTPPQAKRHNLGGAIGPIDTGQELFMGRQQQQGSSQGLPQQLQFLPPYLQQKPGGIGQKPKMVGDGTGNCHQQQQQAIIDQLYKAAELVQSGDPVLAQGILARLNQQLSPIGKPFLRAAFYCKEALQLLLHATNNNMNPSSATSPFSLIFKIGAYKSFSEISPISQFANFTCNQALLEALEAFDRIHIVDFDIGYGCQWSSFMQELALRSGGAAFLKITALASPSTHDQLELGLTRENLMHFASEINMPFEFEILSLDSLNSSSWSLPLHLSDTEAIAVNLPLGSFSSYQLSLPLVLRFVKQLSPKIVVSVDRGCDRTDILFPNHVILALQSYSNLLESLDAVNVNFDALQKIERFLLQPGIEKIVMGRYRSPEKTQHWRTLFLSSGFSPLTFSNFTESQAECVAKRTPVQGFHVEKRQSSLVLCWQRKELISASAWRC